MDEIPNEDRDALQHVAECAMASLDRAVTQLRRVRDRAYFWECVNRAAQARAAAVAVIADIAAGSADAGPLITIGEGATRTDLYAADLTPDRAVHTMPEPPRDRD